ncbi:MAG: winged helix-turn-helix domain-containing protein [Myxococcales bacterium]|nr:winged helix-turn-helix domain-containing protein [Myxococcales bacterium]
MDVAQIGSELHEAVCRGALKGLDNLLSFLDDATGDEADAWKLALETARWLVEPAAAAHRADASTVPARLARFVGAGPGCALPAVIGCGHAARAALVAWDVERLDAIRDVHRALAASGQPDAARTLRRVESWSKLMRGEVDDLEAEGKALYAEGSQAQDASLVIDATLLRAMAALTSGDVETATSLTRRASRMARTEGLRAERILASLVLARVRRRGGRPHLATRIASSIGPMAPGAWQGWLRWERALAGWRPVSDARTLEVDLALADAPDQPSTRGARALLRWLNAASAGDHEATADARAAVLREVAGFADLATEATALAAALDPFLVSEDAPEVVRPWARGDVDDTPAGLHGIVGPPDGPADSTIASVVCRPGAAPRRVLRVAIPLLGGEAEILRVERTRLRRGRVDTAIAALALAGGAGLVDSELFERAYEFEFVPTLHAGILDVLVHRMRARLEEAAEVHRQGGRLRLEPKGVLVLPDPRCVEHVEDRLLRVIARHGGITTRQAAQELDVSVRTAQLALRRLLASGDCVLNRDGRSVQYLVEDTTFTEPTRF